MTRNYTSVQDCIDVQAEICATAVFGDGSAWTVADEQKCAASVQASISCEDVASYAFDGSGSLWPDCNPKPGTKDDGATCKAVMQCKSLNCAVPAGQTCGTCAVALAIGDDCSEGICPLDSVCAAGTHTCVKPGDIGDTCGYLQGRPCKAILGCVGGKCVAAPKDGEACDPKGWMACGIGHWCNAVTQKCEMMKAEAKDTEACGVLASGTLDFCGHGLVCKFTDSTTLAGVCQPEVAIGGACDDQTQYLGGTSCAYPGACVGGTCTTYYNATCP